MKSKKCIRIFNILWLASLTARVVWADGLSTTYADVRVEGIVVGEPVPAKDAQGYPMVLKNLGDSPITVRIEAMIPTAEQLRGGAKPVLSAAWVSANPATLEIPANGQETCTIMVNVPSRHAYKGKLYQVMLWSHVVPSKSGGMALSAGLLSRLRFRTKK